MASQRAAKPRRAKPEKLAGARRPTGKTAKTVADEELGPERRTELAQQAQARRFRGRPPSI